jgi:soluble lytic murein transglycosylase-like protein
MNSVQKAIIPGIAVSILFLVSLSRLILPTPIVSAATEEVGAPLSSEMETTNATCEFAASYPSKIFPWCQLIETSAVKYAVDPLLIAAVMLQESGGQPEVLSSSGAVGLMQVMPRDGISAEFQCINGPCFANRPTIQELKDPAFNVDYGVRMLSGLINRHGDVREALKSYGPYDVGYLYADKVLAIRGQF